jgi:hypothetical protein
MQAGRHADRLTDGETDMMKLVVVFCNFANVPKNQVFTPQKML